jgi:hypothetical protein
LGGRVCIAFIRVLLLGVPQATYLLGKREEYAHGKPGRRRGVDFCRGER